MPSPISRTFKRRVQTPLHLGAVPKFRLLVTSILISVSILLMNVIVNPATIALAGFIILGYVAVALIVINSLPELLRFLRSRLWFSVFLGEIFFAIITIPANAAIFDTAERYTSGIFGQYIDGSMITLIFGFLRISSFIMGAAFVMLALEKARHGENWQPFAWNAFAVLMVVVLVEGMSTLFLSTTAATPSASPRP